MTQASTTWIRRPALWALAAFLIGFARSYLPYISFSDRFFFGDLSDGYFNLWVMEHFRDFLTSGDLSGYLHSRVFTPSNHLVLFWSDNLVVPGLLYSALRPLTDNPATAFNLTTLVLISAGFWVIWGFFREIYLIASKSAPETLISPFTSLGLALLTYVSAFSDGRLMLIAHFQNQMLNFVLLGATCLMRFLRSPSPIRFSAVLGSWLILCYSTPYYALGFGLLAAVFALLFLRHFGWEEVERRMKAYVIVLAGAGLLVLPVAAGYMAIRSPYANQAEHSARLWHIFLPDSYSALGQFFRQHGREIPYRHHESLAYAGLFLAPLLLGILLWQFGRFLPGRTHLTRAAALLGSAVFTGLVWKLAHGNSPWAFAAVALLMAGLGGVLLRRSSPELLLPGWLIVAVVLCYGTALGPTEVSTTNPSSINPSFWGILAGILPAYDSIRAVGRFGALGFSFALGLTWYAIAAAPNSLQRSATSLLFAGMLLTVIFDPPRPPYCHAYDVAPLTPTSTERSFFAAHPGRILILPVNNLSLIPGHMVYFEQLPDQQLVNGYSGRFPSQIERLFTVDAIATPGPIHETIAATGPSHLLYDKRAYSPEELDRLNALYGASTIFENGAFRLAELARP